MKRDQPFLHADNRALFEAEASDLIGDLQTLPDNAALRKINDLIKRARLAKVRLGPACSKVSDRLNVFKYISICKISTLFRLPTEDYCSC